MNKPRVIVTIEGGLVESIAYDGIDLSHVELIVIDMDTEGADPEETSLFAGCRAFFSVGGLEQAERGLIEAVEETLADE